MGVASQAAVATVLQSLRIRTINVPVVSDCIDLANRRVRESADVRNSLGNMGTTLVVWAISGPGRYIVGHVGDSRAYRYRDGQLLRLTNDHSVVQQLVDDGLITSEEAQISSRRNLITRAVWLDSTVDPEVV